MLPFARVGRLAIAQGLYYVLTGVWPLVSMRTFERVTGPKVDGWLVKTVGVLVTVIGAVLSVAGTRRRVTPEIGLLAGGSAAGLAGIDTRYAATGRISSIYLLDALAEVALVALWLTGGNAWRRRWSGMPGRASSRSSIARPGLMA